MSLEKHPLLNTLLNTCYSQLRSISVDKIHFYSLDSFKKNRNYWTTQHIVTVWWHVCSYSRLMKEYETHKTRTPSLAASQWIDTFRSLSTRLKLNFKMRTCVARALSQYYICLLCILPIEMRRISFKGTQCTERQRVQRGLQWFRWSLASLKLEYLTMFILLFGAVLSSLLTYTNDDSVVDKFSIGIDTLSARFHWQKCAENNTLLATHNIVDIASKKEYHVFLLSLIIFFCI